MIQCEQVEFRVRQIEGLIEALNSSAGYLNFIAADPSHAAKIHLAISDLVSERQQLLEQLSGPETPSPTHKQPENEPYYSCADLAKRHGVDPEALRKRLERFRKSTHEGWWEIPERRHHQPTFLYNEAAVAHIIQDLGGRFRPLTPSVD